MTCDRPAGIDREVSFGTLVTAAVLRPPLRRVGRAAGLDAHQVLAMRWIV